MIYSELKTQVASYLHRTDLAAQVPTFISIAEAYLFRELHIKDSQLSTDLTTTGEYADLPVDFLSLNKITATYQGVTYALDYQNEPETYTGQTTPTKYAFENGQIRIAGASTGTVVTLYYTPKITALSDTNTTNWLLENAPDLYLYASCLEGAKYTRNAMMVQGLTPMVSDALEAVKRFIERRGQPSTGSLQIKAR
jgi:hypothetical protein